ncbi:MAG TPA: hypothetical protein VFE62_08850, partial [Gemmataceae bacterium]|nr:hypothetical protein [Gemmataceae bacterium]
CSLDRQRRPGARDQGITLAEFGNFVLWTTLGNALLGNPVDGKHLWNQTTMLRTQKRDFNGTYTLVMSPRWYDARTNSHLALDTGGGPP